MQPASSPGWQVHISRHIAQVLYSIQRRAATEGRGKDALQAIKQIHELLSRQPMNTGEALYHLEALRLYVRTVVVRPLAVDFAVSEERPIVFSREYACFPHKPWQGE